jgi:hypothetical protein
MEGPSGTETMSISNSLKRLAQLPSDITKILHVVTPPGHIPANWQAISDFCKQNGIKLILSHH